MARAVFRGLCCVAGIAALGVAPAALRSDAAARHFCGTSPGGAERLMALHCYAAAGPRGRAAEAARDRDEDHVALLADQGDLVIRRNPFDLDHRSVRLVPNRSGGFDPVPLALPLDAPGAPLNLGEDEAREIAIPFAFPFFGARHGSAFVSADGRLTFGSPDDQSGDKGLGRLLAGPPSVAAFFSDLDPSRGGTITLATSAEAATVQWSAVPGGGQVNRNTFQVTLRANGAIDLVWGEMQSREAVVGAVPGRSMSITAADLSAGLPTSAAGAIVERFSETEKVDLVSVARRFYASHPDAFDQLVVYSTRPLNPAPGTFAFELNLRNDVRGIGVEVVDHTRAWGSAGELESLVYMDTIDSYLEVDGFEVLGHEVGHRWLARLRFRDASGAVRDDLLGDGVHWSFFMDTDASMLGGNDIRDLGRGRFETVDFVRRFSALDQYAMGLRPAALVPPVFYVAAADDFRPNRSFRTTSSPEAGVSFTGERRDVGIDQVVAAMGPRDPPPSASAGPWRVAFVLVSDGTAPGSDAQRRAIARIRARFEGFFAEATDGRGAADTMLP